jgi:hypothetical protein
MTLEFVATFIQPLWCTAAAATYEDDDDDEAGSCQRRLQQCDHHSVRTFVCVCARVHHKMNLNIATELLFSTTIVLVGRYEKN